MHVIPSICWSLMGGKHNPRCWGHSSKQGTPETKRPRHVRVLISSSKCVCSKWKHHNFICSGLRPVDLSGFSQKQIWNEMAAPTWDPWTLRESIKWLIINLQNTVSITLREPNGNYAQQIHTTLAKLKCFCLMVTHSNAHVCVSALKSIIIVQ